MKDDKKRFSKLVWLLILPLELTPKTAREKRWADFPDNFFGLILRKSDYLSCFGLWMRFFQQSQAKVHGQKPLPCTKTNKTYLAKHPSTYFFIGSQMVGFHGTSTYTVHYGYCILYPSLENNFPSVRPSPFLLCVRPFITFSTHPPMCVCPFVRSSSFRPLPKKSMHSVLFF